MTLGMVDRKTFVVLRQVSYIYINMKDLNFNTVAMTTLIGTIELAAHKAI